MNDLHNSLNPEIRGRDMEHEIRDLANALGRSGANGGQTTRAATARIGAEELERRKWMAAISLLLLAIIFTAMNLTGHGPTALRPPDLSDTERGRRLEIRLAIAVAEIDSFVTHFKQFPNDIEDLGLPQTSGMILEHIGGNRLRVTADDGNTSLFVDWTNRTEGTRQ